MPYNKSNYPDFFTALSAETLCSWDGRLFYTGTPWLGSKPVAMVTYSPWREHHEGRPEGGWCLDCGALTHVVYCVREVVSITPLPGIEIPQEVLEEAAAESCKSEYRYGCGCPD